MNREQLKEILKNHRYQSLRGYERGLMDHHIEALSDYLSPYFETMQKRIRELEASASWDEQHDRKPRRRLVMNRCGTCKHYEQPWGRCGKERRYPKVKKPESWACLDYEAKEWKEQQKKAKEEESNLTEQEYKETQQALILLAQAVSELDLPAFLDKISYAHAAAPIFDPTLYSKAADKLRDVERLAAAANQFRKEVLRQKAEL